MDKNIIIRIDSSLKKKVDYLARSEGKNSSIVIRELLAEYVQIRDLGAHIDGIWSKISKDLRKSGARAADISKAIREVRADA